MAEPARASLLGLPLELRQKIYKPVLPSDLKLTSYGGKTMLVSIEAIDHRHLRECEPSPDLGIRRVSHQCHREAAQIFRASQQLFLSRRVLDRDDIFEHYAPDLWQQQRQVPRLH